MRGAGFAKQKLATVKFYETLLLKRAHLGKQSFFRASSIPRVMKAGEWRLGTKLRYLVALTMT